LVLVIWFLSESWCLLIPIRYPRFSHGERRRHRRGGLLTGRCKPKRRLRRRTPKGKPLPRHSPVWRDAARREAFGVSRRAEAALARACASASCVRASESGEVAPISSGLVAALQRASRCRGILQFGGAPQNAKPLECGVRPDAVGATPLWIGRRRTKLVDIPS